MGDFLTVEVGPRRCRKECGHDRRPYPGLGKVLRMRIQAQKGEGAELTTAAGENCINRIWETLPTKLAEGANPTFLGADLSFSGRAGKKRIWRNCKLAMAAGPGILHSLTTTSAAVNPDRNGGSGRKELRGFCKAGQADPAPPPKKKQAYETRHFPHDKLGRGVYLAKEMGRKENVTRKTIREF